MTRLIYLSTIFTVALLAAATVSAQARTVNVHFGRGSSEGNFRNSIKGYDSVDFVFSARAGQRISVTLLSSTKDKAIFTIMKDGDPIAGDAVETKDWTGDLPSDGKQVVRVYMMRADARRTKTPVSFALRISIV
jgi:hypothetical protein